jgi:hypothetical protein
MSRGGRLLIQESYSSSATMSTYFADTPLAEEDGNQRPQIGQLAAVRRLELQHHDGDDAIAERFQPVLVHASTFAPFEPPGGRQWPDAKILARDNDVA